MCVYALSNTVHAFCFNILYINSQLLVKSSLGQYLQESCAVRGTYVILRAGSIPGTKDSLIDFVFINKNFIIHIRYSMSH